MAKHRDLNKEAAKLIEEIREQRRRVENCPGHRFERIAHAQDRTAFSRPHVCVNCHWHPHAGEIVAYLQGLEHGIHGHTRLDADPENVFTKL